MPDYVPPKFEAKAFNCPHCGAYAHMEWAVLQYLRRGVMATAPAKTVICMKCQKHSIWQISHGSVAMVYPRATGAPAPHAKMPAAVRADYEEAAAVLNASPMAAAGLLRLGIQRLCIELGLPGEHLNSDVRELVNRGLPTQVSQGLHALRVIGNKSVHPGQLSRDDVAEVALTLFKAINMIVEYLIALPEEMADLFESLPEGAREDARAAIARAESKAKGAAE